MPVGLVVAGSIFIRGLGNIGTVAFSKDLEFHRVFKFSIYPRVLGVITTIIAAFVLRSYWAIVIGIFMNALYGTAFSYSANPHWPRWRLEGMEKFWHFSKWVLIGNMGRQLFNMMDRLALSGWLNKQHLGFFTVAGDLASILTVELFGPVSQALTPGFAKLQHDRERLRDAFVISVSVFLALIIPASTGVWLLSAELVPVILGDQWHDAAKFVGMLSWFSMFFAFSEILTGFLSMVGLNERSARLSLGRAILFGALLYFAFHFYHVEGIILLKITLAAGESLILYRMAMGYLGLPALTPLAVCWRPILAAGCMAFVVNALTHSLGSNLFLLLASKAVIGALTYTFVTLGLWLLAGKPKGMESMLFDLLKSRLTRTLPGTP
jgi:lipopolysaccharide exporter